MDSLTQYHLGLHLLTHTPFESCQFSALAVYSDLFTAYLQMLARRTRDTAELAGRTRPCAVDLKSLIAMFPQQLQLDDLQAYYRTRKHVPVIDTFISSSFPVFPPASSSVNAGVDGDSHSNNRRRHARLTEPWGMPWLPNLEIPMGAVESNATTPPVLDASVVSPISNTADVISVAATSLASNKAAKKQAELATQKSRDWSIKRPTNPYLFIEEYHAESVDEKLVDLPAFPASSAITQTAKSAPISKALMDISRKDIQLFPIADSDVHKFDSELLAMKTTINYTENPHGVEYPPLKRRKFFLASRKLLDASAADVTSGSSNAPANIVAAAKSVSSSAESLSLAPDNANGLAAGSNLASPFADGDDDIDSPINMTNEQQPVFDLFGGVKVADLNVPDTPVITEMPSVESLVEEKSNSQSSVVEAKDEPQVIEPIKVEEKPPVSAPKLKIKFSFGASSTGK